MLASHELSMAIWMAQRTNEKQLSWTTHERYMEIWLSQLINELTMQYSLSAQWALHGVLTDQTK